MKAFKKLIVYVVMLFMMLSVLPTSVFADEFYPGNDGANKTYAQMTDGLVDADSEEAVACIYVWDDPVAKTDVYRKLYYSSIDAAIKAAQISVDYSNNDGKTALSKRGYVVLIKNWKLDKDVVLPLTFTYGGNNSICFNIGETYTSEKIAEGYHSDNSNITVDLNGHTIRHATEDRYKPSTNFGYNGYAEFYVNNKATLTIKDTSKAGTGKIIGPNAATWVNKGGTMNLESGTLCVSADENTINGGSYQTGGFIRSSYYGVINEGTFNLKGGTIDLRNTYWVNPADSTNYHEPFGIYQYNAAAVTNWTSGSVLSDRYVAYNVTGSIMNIKDKADGKIKSQGRFYGQSDEMSFITVPRSIKYNPSAEYQKLPVQSLVSVYQDYFEAAKKAQANSTLVTNVYQFFYGANASNDTTHGVVVTCDDSSATAEDKAIALSAVLSGDGDFYFSDDLKTLNFKIDREKVKTLSKPTTITIQICVGGGATNGETAYNYSGLHYHVAYEFTMELTPVTPPNTGDENNIYLYGTLLFVALSGAVILIRNRKKNNYSN